MLLQVVESVLGRNCRIGKDAQVRGSYLHDDVVVGDSAQIDSALICQGAVVHGDAVVMAGAILSFKVGAAWLGSADPPTHPTQPNSTQPSQPNPNPSQPGAGAVVQQYSCLASLLPGAARPLPCGAAWERRNLHARALCMGSADTCLRPCCAQGGPVLSGGFRLLALNLKL